MLQLQWVLSRRPRVAVVEISGMIGGRLRPEPYVELLHGLRQAPWARAVVLSIDSPGGSAWASDYLRMAVARLAKEKPVVAFVRGLGASGAYLVASAAHRIIALPSALVGSIGVISLRPMARELLQRVGVQFVVTKSGPLKDMGAFYRDPTEEETRKEQELVDAYHSSFVEAVAMGRALPMEEALVLATGEVYTSQRALELRLVDALGDMEQAQEAAAELGDVPQDQVTQVRPKLRLRDLLGGSLAPGAASNAHLLLSNHPLFLAPAYAQEALLELMKR